MRQDQLVQVVPDGLVGRIDPSHRFQAAEGLLHASLPQVEGDEQGIVGGPSVIELLCFLEGRFGFSQHSMAKKMVSGPEAGQRKARVAFQGGHRDLPSLRGLRVAKFVQALGA